MKTKPRRFMKVVEWEDNQDWNAIWFGIALILVSTIFFCLEYVMPQPNESLQGVMWYVVMVTFFHLAGWCILLFIGIGHGRKEYWEETNGN
jgi:hypothetical protein